jgi:apolipoprotein N-acyltransferase
VSALVGLSERLIAQRGFLGFLIAVFLGALGVLGHAPFHFWPAFAVSVTGLLLLLDGASARQRPLRSGFFVAWSWAFGYFLAGMFWVGDAFLVDAEKFAALMPFAVTALPAGLALFSGLAGAAYAKVGRRDASRLFIFACAFGAAEFARGHLFTGLPWNLPAYIWKPGGIISQTSALIGPYGLSIGTLLVLALPAVFTARANRKAVGAIAVCLAIVSVGFGIWRLHAAGPLDPMAGKGPLISAGQAGFTQKEVWDPANALRVTTTYLDLLDNPEARKADIVVWPEGAFPYLLQEQPEVIGAIDAKLGRRTLVVGSIRRETNATATTYWNSIFVLDKTQGRLAQRGVYDKFHLVPFGEYLPLRPLFKALGIASLVAYDGEMTPGVGPSTLAVTGAPLADARICYEIVFPFFNPKANGKASWILNVSIDAWFGDLLGPDQHYAQARARAIETGMPLVRAASGGWSAIVDRYGRPLAEHQKGAGYAFARLPLDARTTPYGTYGEVFFALFLVILLGLSFILHHKSVDFRDRLDDEALTVQEEQHVK